MLALRDEVRPMTHDKLLAACRAILSEDHCSSCFKPRATADDYEKYAPGEGAHLCWEGYGRCYGDMEIEDLVKLLATEVLAREAERGTA